MAKRVVHVHVVCWNEADLVPWICAHYAQFATRIFFHDNHSDDATRDLIRRCPIAEIFDYSTGGQVRDDLLRDLKNSCWRGRGADWVICVDADEFVVIPGGEVAAAFESYQRAQIAVPKCGWIEMVGEGIPLYRPGTQLYDVVSAGVVMAPSKCPLFKAPAVEEIAYGLGAHACSPRLREGWLGPADADPTPHVLHFKYARGLQGVLDRHAITSARFSDLNRRHGLSGHWLDVPGTVRTHEALRATARSLAFPVRAMDNPSAGTARPPGNGL